jgi:hypothetical protein
MPARVAETTMRPPREGTTASDAARDYSTMVV